MPADRDQTKSRKFVVIAGVALLALVLLAGAFIVLNPLQRGGKTVRPGEESSARKGPAEDEEESETGKRTEPRASASGPAVKSSDPAKDATAGGSNGGKESTKPGDESSETANIDPEEIS